MSSSQAEIERLQNILNRCQRQNQQLQDLNQTKTGQIDSLQKRLAQLQIRDQHPLNLLAQHRNPLAGEGELIKLEHILNGQAGQLNYLQQTNQSMQGQLIILQTRLIQLQLLLNEKDNTIEKLSQKINNFKQTVERLKSQTDTLNKKIEQLFKEKLNLIDEKEVLSKTIKDQQCQSQKTLTDISKGVESFRDFLTSKQHQQEKQEKYPKDSQNHNEMIMKLQLDELQERNEEIQRLRTMCNGTQITMEEANLKNTIKHLKGQLGKSNMRMKEVVAQSRLAEEIIINYKEAMQKCENQLNNLQNLKQQNNFLRNEIDRLQGDNQSLRNLLVNQKAANQQKSIILRDVLTENQCYHQLMYNNYDQNYLNFVQKDREAYLNRMQQRKKQEKWVNIEQLIEVNENMRRKLKLI